MVYLPYCKHACRRLHLPPNAFYFACRKCHHLTYASAQDAHEFDHGSMAVFAEAVDVLAKLDKVLDRLGKTRYGSKRYWRLIGQWEKLEAKLERNKRLNELWRGLM